MSWNIADELVILTDEVTELGERTLDEKDAQYALTEDKDKEKEKGKGKADSDDDWGSIESEEKDD